MDRYHVIKEISQLFKANQPQRLTNELVALYFEHTMGKKRPKKHPKFYTIFGWLYKHQRVHGYDCHSLLMSMHRRGYWGDYLHLLDHCDYGPMKENIYKLLVDQFNRDKQSMQTMDRISTLAKWLPREGSELGKRLRFMSEFQHAGAQFRNPREYRKTLSLICERLDVLERKMCGQQFGDIDFHQIPHRALRKNYHALMKREECRRNYTTFLQDKWSKCPAHIIMKRLLKLDGSKRKLDIEVLTGILTNNWKQWLPQELQPFWGPETMLIVDTGQGTMNADVIQHLAVIICAFISISKQCWIARRTPVRVEFTSVLPRDVMTQVLKSTGPCTEIDMEKFPVVRHQVVITNGSVKNGRDDLHVVSCVKQHERMKLKVHRITAINWRLWLELLLAVCLWGLTRVLVLV